MLLLWVNPHVSLEHGSDVVVVCLRRHSVWAQHNQLHTHCKIGTDASDHAEQCPATNVHATMLLGIIETL